MTTDQMACAVIVVLPVAVLLIDWFLNSPWTVRLCRITVLPWAMFSIGYMIVTRNWNVAALVVVFGFAFATQESAKGLYRK
jgi:hypothetical protein